MKKLIIKAIFFVATVLPVIVMSQPQPWDPAIGGGEGNSPVGGGAPVGGGLIILLSLAASYGAKKVFGKQKKS